MSEPLIEGFVLDGKGGARPMSVDELHAGPDVPKGGFYWAHLDLGADQDWLRRKAGLDAVVVQSLLANETRPRSTVHGSGLMMTLRGVNLNPESQSEDMVSLRVWVEKGRLITVRKRRLVAVEDLRKTMRDGHGPDDAGTLLFQILRGLTNKMEPVVDDLADRVDVFEEQSLTATVEELRGPLAAMRHDAIVFRRYIAPQREAYARFAANETGLLHETLQNASREEADRLTRVVEELDITRERAGIIHDQLVDRRSEEMNRNMLVLSVVTAIFLPLGFLTGLLGINVGGMPGAGMDHAFWIVCGLLLCITLGELWLFRMMKWI
ncbi:zinc transporter ZntB [Aquisalinus flavus]|uniref:Transporter n=1 Tax=Aquisalinus flavus TaxID=1526572 RepID=A0A8J2V5H5_9PROT|nr:zinc transporter ZntB [Aquisalinus flavus]MBD0425944.1 zinc transporter ZntB [Aquisalinus flavus]UNE48463.1 zinc transporter ZntB [Aquisalinus flavus]GGD11975.1 transporter [Aquisalinus flavus]